MPPIIIGTVTNKLLDAAYLNDDGTVVLTRAGDAVGSPVTGENEVMSLGFASV